MLQQSRQTMVAVAILWPHVSSELGSLIQRFWTIKLKLSMPMPVGLRPKPFLDHGLEVGFSGNSWHEHRVRVQYADTDRMDMVYHGTYARFFEAARVEMLRDLGVVYAKMEQEGVLLPVVQLNMSYRKPVGTTTCFRY